MERVIDSDTLKRMKAFVSEYKREYDYYDEANGVYDYEEFETHTLINFALERSFKERSHESWFQQLFHTFGLLDSSEDSYNYFYSEVLKFLDEIKVKPSRDIIDVASGPIVCNQVLQQGISNPIHCVDRIMIRDSIINISNNVSLVKQDFRSFYWSKFLGKDPVIISLCPDNATPSILDAINKEGLDSMVLLTPSRDEYKVTNPNLEVVESSLISPYCNEEFKVVKTKKR